MPPSNEIDISEIIYPVPAPKPKRKVLVKRIDAHGHPWPLYLFNFILTVDDMIHSTYVDSGEAIKAAKRIEASG